MSFDVSRRGALEFYTSGALAVRHGFSTRPGGVSEGHLASLNLGVYRGDRAGNVLENWRRFAGATHFDWRQLVFTRQTHTDIVRVVTEKDAGRGLILPVEGECDALVTNTPGLTLAVFAADCTPVLLWDPVTNAVGAAHAGWRGAAAGIAARTAEAMAREFGCKPGNLCAAIGPCISACCFETHRDVPDAMRAALGAEAEAAIRPVGEKFLVDLKKINALWLARAGVGTIDICPECTCCNPDLFWTHRKTGERRGSLAGVITCPAGDAP